MHLRIHLIGPPRILRDADAVPAMRGRKAWALLAYLVLRKGGVGRHHLAALLFEDAADPMATLRWNLSELRRALGGDILRGDPVELDAATRACADVSVLARGDWAQALAIADLGCELLEGMSFCGSPSFDVWLQSERRRVQATTHAVLREAALAHLANKDARAAAEVASRLVVSEPLDENFQVLLVRCLSASGDGVGAARQAAACKTLFERELGVAPGPALAAALNTVTASPVTRPATGRAGALAQLEAGEAAIRAGVLEAGLQCLRRAMTDADASGDPALRARTRVALGGALVHAARGRDEEGAAALHEALAIGAQASPVLAAAACRELGYVEFLRGRYERAQAWLERAAPLARQDPVEQSRIATVHGSILSDMAFYGEALAQLRRAQALAEEAGDIRQAVYAMSMRGRAQLLCGELDAAAQALDRSIEQARSLWTAFLPWPQSLRAEVDLLSSRTDAAFERYEQAFQLGCQLEDPCWEGIAGRGLGRVAMTRGDAAGAVVILRDTLQRCARLPDAYLWGKAYVLDALCQVAVAGALPDAPAQVEALMGLAAGSGMRELVYRAHGYRAALGDASSAAAMPMLASQIDNPALRAAPSAG